MVNAQKVFVCDECRMPYIDEEQEEARKCCKTGKANIGFMCDGCNSIHPTEEEAEQCCKG